MAINITVDGKTYEGVEAITVGGKVLSLSYVEGSTGGGEGETPVNYTITAELVNVTSSNSATNVQAGNSYTATLSAADGYALDSVTVMMGGVDVTANVYADGVISIASVTGNVEIVASASAVSAEAELPTDGLVSYFDFRTAEYVSDATRGLTTIAPTQGSGQMFAWAADQVAEQGDYGMRKVQRSFLFDKNGGTTQTDLGTELTVISLAYGHVAGPGFIYMNLAPLWAFNPSYTDASGNSVATEKKSGSLFNSDSKDDYNFCVYRVNGKILTEIMDTSSVDYDGDTIESFASWEAKVSAGTVLTGEGMYFTATAIYDRALTDVEIEEARAFFKTLEVTA